MIQEVLSEPDLIKQFLHERFSLFLTDDLVQLDCFANDATNGQPGIERSVRVLKDDLHVFSLFFQLFFAQTIQILSIEQDLSLCRFNQAQDSPASR